MDCNRGTDDLAAEDFKLMLIFFVLSCVRDKDF